MRHRAGADADQEERVRLLCFIKFFGNQRELLGDSPQKVHQPTEPNRVLSSIMVLSCAPGVFSASQGMDN
jgi:hypothetical protein